VTPLASDILRSLAGGFGLLAVLGWVLGAVMLIGLSNGDPLWIGAGVIMIGLFYSGLVFSMRRLRP
jgi:hypothetical protein